MLFTSESVTEGHPDKMADQISDSILDAILAQDPNGRVACETLVTTGQVHVVGEVSTNCYVDIPKIIRETVREIGYTRAKYGFDADTCGILVSLDEQSPDIAQGVDKALEAREGDMDVEDAIGAGDQGMMFGYATNETEEYMPLTIALAHRLARRLAEVRKDGTLSYLRPDGKTQVTVLYEDGKPVAVDTIVISTQHDEDVELAKIRKDLIEHVIKAVVPAELLTDETKILVNPTGKFVIGGPQGDSGLTARSSSTRTAAGHATAAVHSRAKTPRRSTAAQPMQRATSPRTSSLPASLTAARSSWPTPSASPIRSPSWSTPSAPTRSTRTRSRRSSRSTSTCVRPASSRCSTCAAPSTSRPQLMATSAAPTSTCHGSTRIRQPSCARKPGSEFAPHVHLDNQKAVSLCEKRLFCMLGL